MALSGYGVLVGRVVDSRREGNAETPHFQLQVTDDAGVSYRIAINVQSQQSPPELLYLINDDLRHPVTATLGGLAAGWNPLPADLLGHDVQRAIGDPAARLYSFGQRWGPETDVPDKVFGFAPGNGVHDIHMNLTGWQIADRSKRACPVPGGIGWRRRDAASVAERRRRARQQREGWTLTF